MSDKPQQRPATPLPATQDDEGKQLAILLDTARALVTEEFQRSERIDAKARHQLTVVGALFAVVMATTAGVLNALVREPQTERPELLGLLFARSARASVEAWVIPTLGGFALGSIFFLFCTFIASAGVWKAREQDTLDPETIKTYVAHAERGKVAVSKNLIDAYARILGDRRDANKRRIASFKRARFLAVLAGMASLAQLAAVFIALINQ